MRILTLAGLAAPSLLVPIALGQSASDIYSEYTELYSVVNRAETPIDLNGDGVLDMAGWWWIPGQEIGVRWWLTNSAGGQFVFGHGVDLGGPSRAFQPGADNATVGGDLDGDGKGDLVISIGSFVEVLVSRPHSLGGSFRFVLEHVQSFDLPANVEKRDAVTHDFDGDGRDELVLVFPHEVRLYSPDQNAVLRLVDTHTIVAGQAWQGQPTAEVADLNGDGQADLAVYSPDLFRVTVFPITGTQFGTPEILRTDLGGAAVQLAAGDVDGDGSVDLVVFQEEIGAGQPHYQLIRRNLSGEFVRGAVRIGGPAASLVDVDGDGDLDGVCCGGGTGGYNGPLNEDDSMFRVCLNDGSGGFEISPSFPSVGAHHLAGAYDYDGDGDIDLVAGRGVLLNHQRVGAEYCPQSANSTGVAGSLAASGTASIGAADFTLTLSDLPPNALFVLVNGLPWPSSPVMVGSGTLCMVSTSIRRSNVGSTDPLGAATIDIGGTTGLGGLPSHFTSWTSLPPGASVGLQVWHRDLASHGGSNVTHGIGVKIAN